MPNFADFDFTPEPHQIQQIYESGFRGALPQDRLSNALYRAGTERFYDAFPQARGLHTELEVCMPIRACQALIDMNFNARREESQRVGDCVGHLVRNQGMIDGCLDSMFGETDWPQGKVYCCENIYGERGHGGEGANCWTLWNCVKPEGSQGFLFRDRYETSAGIFDLSSYQPDLESRWGRGGTPSALGTLAKENPALKVYKAKSIEEVMDALALGFGVGRCGGDGFNSERNDDGVSDRRGSWAHAIAVGGFNRSQAMMSRYDGELFLYYHDWGEWNRGPKTHEQPDGSWWVRRRYLEDCVRSGEVAIIASVVGVNRKLIWEQKMDRRSFLIKEGIHTCVSS